MTYQLVHRFTVEAMTSDSASRDEVYRRLVEHLTEHFRGERLMETRVTVAKLYDHDARALREKEIADFILDDLRKGKEGGRDMTGYDTEFLLCLLDFVGREHLERARREGLA
jgi:hypothetical protein